MRFWMEITGSDGFTRHFPIARAVTVIGRAPESHIRIPLRCVEWRHCHLEWNGAGGLRMTAANESARALVNGHPVGVCTLHPGDELCIGPVRFAIRAVTEAGAGRDTSARAANER